MFIFFRETKVGGEQLRRLRVSANINKIKKTRGGRAENILLIMNSTKNLNLR